MQATWMPHEEHGRLSARSDLPDTVYAFPNQRKEPLTDARHVRNAVARFDQVIGVSDADRALAFANIEKAAKYYNVDLSETSWRDLGVHPQRHRKEAAAKGAATRKREREERFSGEFGWNIFCCVHLRLLRRESAATRFGLSIETVPIDLTVGDPAARELSRRGGEGAEAHAANRATARPADRGAGGPAEGWRGDPPPLHRRTRMGSGSSGRGRTAMSWRGSACCARTTLTDRCSARKDEESRRCCDLTVGLIVDRLLASRSKLGFVRAINGETASRAWATSWRSTRWRGARSTRRSTGRSAAAARRERAGARHLKNGTLVLYHSVGPIWRAGNARWGSTATVATMAGPAAVVYGLLCTREGLPAAVEVSTQIRLTLSSPTQYRQTETALRAEAHRAGRRPWNADQRAHPRRDSNRPGSTG